MQQPTVASKSAAVEAMCPDWDLARALLGGTRAMREAGEKYLPRWPNEDQTDYQKRKATAVLFPAYKRTVETLAAKPFSKPITLEDVPDDFAEWLQDVDLEGRNLDTFAASVMEDALGYGLSGILVDFPNASEVQTSAAGIRTLADERAAGLRPYWVHIRPWQVLGWRASRRNGDWVLEQLRLMESVDEPDGDWAVKKVDQIRVLEPNRWSTYRKVKEQRDEWLLYDEGATTLGRVPFVPVYGKRLGFMVAEPPLIEVANLNVAHWQSASDQQTLLHVARVPILTVTGVQDGVGPNGESVPWTFTVGASAAVKLPAGGDMKFVEHTGAAIDAGSQDLDKLEERMRQAGAELLVIAPGKVTATQVHTENAVGMSALQRITLGLEDAIDAALAITAEWVGQDAPGSVKLFNDYGSLTLAEASAQLLFDATQAGRLSGETWLKEMQRRGIVSADVDYEDERERITAEGPALGTMADEAPPTGSDDPADDADDDTAPSTPLQQSAPLDLAPIAEAIREAVEALKASQPAPLDLAGLIAAMQAPAINVTAPAADMSGIAAAMETFSAALAAIQPAQVTVNPPAITVEGSTTTVNVPEQPAPNVNVSAPAVNVAPPNVNVTVEKGGTVRFTEDGAGNLTGAVME